MEGAVTFDDILDELADLYSEEMRQEYDVDANQLAERMNITSRQALNRMEKIAASGGWQRLKVFDPNTSNRRWVLRKVT